MKTIEDRSSQTTKAEKIFSAFSMWAHPMCYFSNTIFLASVKFSVTSR